MKDCPQCLLKNGFIEGSCGACGYQGGRPSIKKRKQLKQDERFMKEMLKD